MRLLAELAAGAVAACLGVSVSAGEPALRIWTLQDGVLAGPAPGDELPVGSLLKPFVAEAWAAAHGDERQPPRFGCDARSRCWRPAGHGWLELRRAVSVSCNAYFRALAADTPSDVLEATLRARGFEQRGRLTPELAIGLPAQDAALTIAPAALLRAYRDLTRTPWPRGESVRLQLLAGLRDAALSGTASGLGQRGYWAKTGTIAALDGRPLATSGYALVIDDAGFGLLALLARGTGRDAATALGPTLSRLRPWTVPRKKATGTKPVSLRRKAGVSPATTVRVRLFDALAPARVLARNLGSFPVATNDGFVGPGASRELRPGQHLGEGLWELELPGSGLTRRLLAGLDVPPRPGRPVVVASLSPREYVAGVLAAEAPAAGLQVDAGAAVLRYLRAGPRHSDADVCDLTHCAFFVGRGPLVVWLAPRLPVVLPGPRRPTPSVGSAEIDWERIQERARQPGPGLWSSHCGGAPLSPHYVWGSGSLAATPCGRHPPGSVPAWRRSWSREALGRALGFEVLRARVEDEDGVWGLRLDGSMTSRRLRFDQAHRLLAEVLGWNALPSPARRITRAPGGFDVEGVGFGHRVGLCLDGSDGRLAPKWTRPR